MLDSATHLVIFGAAWWFMLYPGLTLFLIVVPLKSVQRGYS
jgi:ABC-type dipeptide/oligopeptide/nickel transport system permease subunit